VIVDYAFYVMATTAETAEPESATLVAQLFANVITTGVIAALITAGVQFFINRKNSRIQERKNAVDEGSDLVLRYKDAAGEERAQKESAVKTVRELLVASEAQVTSLKETVKTLTETIQLMSSFSDSQKDIISRLEVERDRTAAQLAATEKLRDEKIAELRAAQIKILEMTMGPEEAERHINDTFGI